MPTMKLNIIVTTPIEQKRTKAMAGGKLLTLSANDRLGMVIFVQPLYYSTLCLPFVPNQGLSKHPTLYFTSFL